MIYFIEATWMHKGPIKIGATKDAKQRFASMQAYCPDELRLIVAVEGDYKDEARGFAAMSPQGRDNIVAVWERLPDLVEQAYRTGFEDGEKHAAENHDYQRGAEADFQSHVQNLRSSREWE